jgi:hypothetical protein
MHTTAIKITQRIIEYNEQKVNIHNLQAGVQRSSTMRSLNFTFNLFLNLILFADRLNLAFDWRVNGTENSVPYKTTATVLSSNSHYN